MEPVKVLVDGEVRDVGVGPYAVDNPTNAVEWLAERRVERGDSLSAGDVILIGSFTGIIELEPGESMECRWKSLDSVTVHRS